MLLGSQGLHLAENRSYKLLYKADDGVLVHEGHLHIQLRELRLPAQGLAMTLHALRKLIEFIGPPLLEVRNATIADPLQMELCWISDVWQVCPHG